MMLSWLFWIQYLQGNSVYDSFMVVMYFSFQNSSLSGFFSISSHILVYVPSYWLLSNVDTPYLALTWLVVITGQIRFLLCSCGTHMEAWDVVYGMVVLYTVSNLFMVVIDSFRNDGYEEFMLSGISFYSYSGNLSI